MKNMTNLFLLGCLLIVLCSCGSTSSVSEPSISLKEEPEQIPIELAEEEFIFHGIHMRIPDAYEMKIDEQNEHQATSSWKNLDTTSYNKGWISFWDEEEIYGDVSLGGENGSYSAASSRIYYSDYSYTGRIDDDWIVERRRINNIDALIQKRPDPENSDKKTTLIKLVLASCVVEIRFDSSSEQFDELFEQCIESIWVEDEEIPDIVKRTSTEALTEAELSTKAWQYQNLYMHVPATYMLVEMDSGDFVWISENGDSYIILSPGSVDMLYLTESEFKNLLKNALSDFEEMTFFWSGNYNGMYASSAGAKSLLNYREITTDWSIFLDDVYGHVVGNGAADENTVLIYMQWITEDTEAEEILTNAWYTIHFADGWVGDGLMEVEPLTQSEFQVKMGQ